MKKIVKICCIVIAFLFVVCSLAEQRRQMQIVNCESWVSMRESANTHSNRLAKVPLGAIVEVLRVDGSFAYCLYDGNAGYILIDYLVDYNEMNFEGYWNSFTLENCKAYMQQINDQAGYEKLYSIHLEDGEVEETYSVVAYISGVIDGRIEIWEGGFFLIESDIDDRNNPILRELYAETAEYFVTNDKIIAITMYDEMLDAFEDEYRRNKVNACIESNEGIGRYMIAFESGGSLTFRAFMGDLQ